jgi:hypothetical protein
MLKRIAMMFSSMLFLFSVASTAVTKADDKPTPTPGVQKPPTTNVQREPVMVEQKNPLGTSRKAHGDPHVNEVPAPGKTLNVDAVKK